MLLFGCSPDLHVTSGEIMNFFMSTGLPTGFGESRLGSIDVLCPVFIVVLHVSLFSTETRLADLSFSCLLH